MVCRERGENFLIKAWQRGHFGGHCLNRLLRRCATGGEKLSYRCAHQKEHQIDDKVGRSRRTIAWRRPAGGTMNLRGLFLVGLCGLCICQHVRADDATAPGLTKLANEVALSAADALGTKPVELLVADAYPLLLRDGLKKVFQTIKSSLLTLIHGDIEKVSDLVMAELKAYLFGSTPVQQKMWRRFRNKFRDYLRDWWLDTLLDPYETLKTGVWQALLKLTADDLSVVIGDTPEYEKLKKLLLDEKAVVIGQWVKRIQQKMMQGVVQQENEGIFSQKQGRFRGKYKKREEGKRPKKENSDSIGEDLMG